MRFFAGLLPNPNAGSSTWMSRAALTRAHPPGPYRFIADELPEKGITAGETKAQRLCRDHGIWLVFSKKRVLNRIPGPPVHDAVVERDFTAAPPNELWLTDITEHPTTEGKLYLCAVKDVYSGRVIGYSMDSRRKSSLAVAALENAVRSRRPAGRVVHSDCGSQFRPRRFVEMLPHHGLTGSMGRVGACADNAAMESFFPCCKRTSRTASTGLADRTSGWPSQPGSRGPTTPATAKTAGKTHANRI